MFRKILALLLCAALLTCCAAALADDASDAAGTASEAAGVPESGDEGASDEAAPQPARGYVLVQTSTQSGWLPLPDEGEYAYHLKQILSDGSEAENVIHVTADGVYMEDSTCDNHDCVAQGTVTLENRDERILSNYIICLPNQVFLQLFTPEEVLEMVAAQQAEDDQP